MKNTIILASGSPRRQELLKLITMNFSISVSNVEENIPSDLDIALVPEYLSKLKADDVACRFNDSVVIGADTCVIIDNEILGKPRSIIEASTMLKKLSGREHKVVTGCTINYKGFSESFSVETLVKFHDLTEKEIAEYINTDEPYDKAGGYGIQSKGALFVKSINGDYYNVVGFPISELNKRLNKLFSQNTDLLKI